MQPFRWLAGARATGLALPRCVAGPRHHGCGACTGSLRSTDRDGRSRRAVSARRARADRRSGRAVSRRRIPVGRSRCIASVRSKRFPGSIVPASSASGRTACACASPSTCPAARWGEDGLDEYARRVVPARAHAHPSGVAATDRSRRHAKSKSRSSISKLIRACSPWACGLTRVELDARGAWQLHARRTA